MKRIFMIIVMIFSIVILSSCYKKERYTFVENTYYLKEMVVFDESKTLENVMLRFNEITKEEYENAEGISVITSRYNDKYYKVSLLMSIDGINYNDIVTTEMLGSTAYNDRYHLMFDLNIENQVYHCHFRMDLYNYSWEKEVKEFETNRIIINIFEQKNDENMQNAKCYANFDLILNNDTFSLKTMHLYEAESWLATLDSSNVEEILMENGYIGVALGTKSKIEYTNNVDEIVRLVSEWKNVTITEVSDNIVAPGGSFRSITFLLKNGIKHSIYLGNGYYEKNNKNYSMSTFPSITEEQVTRVDFNYGIYNGTQVLMTDVYDFYDAVVWSETIEDLTFTYNSSNRLYAFNNGIKYTLTEAYENELLTKEDLQLVNSSYIKDNPNKDIEDDGMVRTELDMFGAPSLPYFVSTEVNKNCLLSEKTTSINVYVGHLKFNNNDVLLLESDDFHPSIEEAKNYAFSIAIRYNGQERVVAADNINYLDSSYDVAMKDIYEGDDYKGTIVNYQKYHEIGIDFSSMTGVSYGYINIELIVTLPNGTLFVIMSDTLYYSVTDTEIVFGLCENPILHEGEPGAVSSGWSYCK